jgi:hypothetical protein
MGSGVYVNGQYIGGNGGGFQSFSNPMMQNQNSSLNGVKKYIFIFIK